jgi:hypothetical protein
MSSFKNKIIIISIFSANFSAFSKKERKISSIFGVKEMKGKTLRFPLEKYKKKSFSAVFSLSAFY